MRWTPFYNCLLLLFEASDDDSGNPAREVLREINSLWVFLYEAGIEPTINRAERALRFALLWRKPSSGTQSDKGNRWDRAATELPVDLPAMGVGNFSLSGGYLESLFQRAIARLKLGDVIFSISTP